MRKLKKASQRGKEVALYEAHAENSFDLGTQQSSGQERGGGSGGGGEGGGGGGNRSSDFNLLTGDGDLQAAGGNSESGGGNCGVTIYDFQVPGGFEHGKCCPEFL